MDVLDLGCGNRKRPGAIGLDCNPDTDADVIHDLNVYPYPFESDSFDEINADSVIEHLDDVIKTMEELHRIARPGALVRIVVPYFRGQWAYIDPTHRHFFAAESFSYFQPGHVNNERYNYSKAHFQIERRVFNESLPGKRLLKWFANRQPVRYEYRLSHLMPLDDLTFYLRVID